MIIAHLNCQNCSYLSFIPKIYVSDSIYLYDPHLWNELRLKDSFKSKLRTMYM